MPVNRAAVALLALSACTRPMERDFAPGTGSLAGTVLRGTVSIDDRQQVFQPCQGEPAWIVDRTGGDLGKIYQDLVHDARPLFVEIRGEPGPAVTRGPGARLGRKVIVYRVRRASVGSQQCDEDLGSTRFRALGVAPNWRIDVKLDAVEVQVGGEPPVLLPGTTPRQSDDGQIWSVRKGNHSLRLSIVERRCVEAMAGDHYDLVAEAVFDGRPLRGCAIQNWK